jgi:hypothetical protein
LDLLNNNGTGKADAGSYLLSVFFIWESLIKIYRYRGATLISVSGPKYFTLVGTNSIESANLHSISDRSNVRTLVANLRWDAGVLIPIIQFLPGVA